MGRARQIASGENQDRIILDSSDGTADAGEFLLLDASAAGTDVGFFINTEDGTGDTPFRNLIPDGSITGARIESDPTISGALTVGDTITSTGAITSSGAIEGTQFQVNGVKVLEVSTADFGNDTNKSVDTSYDFTHSLAAGTWMPFIEFNVSIFENHSNSNPTGLYYPFLRLGTSSGGEQIGNFYKAMPKWGNATNSYNDASGSFQDPFTLATAATIYIRWYCGEYGGSSNFWCRNSGNKVHFMRIG